MAAKKRITKKVLFKQSVGILQTAFNLSDWTIWIHFSGRMKVTADCQADPEYKEATIRINTKTLSELSCYEVIATAVHKLLHCIVWPLGSWAEKLSRKDEDKLDMTRQFEETVVTSLERVMVPLVAEKIKEELAKQGYPDISVVFSELMTFNEN